MYSQTEHYTAMVVNMQCKYMSFLHVRIKLQNSTKRISNGQSKKNNPEKLATYKTKKNKTKTQDMLDTTMRTQTQLA
jgi:hypothetical protein